MLVDFVWNVFTATGSIDSYVFMKEIQERYKSDQEENVKPEEVAMS